MSGAGSSVHAGCARAHARACSASTGSQTTDGERSNSRTIPGASCGYSRTASHHAAVAPDSRRRRNIIRRVYEHAFATQRPTLGRAADHHRCLRQARRAIGSRACWSGGDANAAARYSAATAGWTDYRVKVAEELRGAAVDYQTTRLAHFFALLCVARMQVRVALMPLNR
jgi:hypothetical protein